MSAAEQDGTLLALSDVARLAGVGVSAVSNWRKRHPAFPEPAATSSAGKDLFRLADLNAWLTSTGREPIAPERVHNIALEIAARASKSSPFMPVQGYLAGLVLRYHLELAGGASHPTDGSVGARPPVRLAELTEVTYPPGLLDQWLEQASLDDDAYREVFDSLIGLAQEHPELLRSIDELTISEAIDSVFAMVYDFEKAGEFSTARQIAQLVARIAPPGFRSVLDPAVGFGFLLNDVIGDDTPDGSVYAQDVNPFALALSMLRFLTRDIDARHFRRGDAYTDDAFAGVLVDLVVCDPPYNLKLPSPNELVGDPRWRYGLPASRDANGAWLQHALAHLGPGGTGIIVLPANSMWQGGKAAETRRALIAAGAVEAIIALPGGMALNTSIPLAIWVLRTPAADHRERPVLLIDAAHDSYLTPSGDGPRTLERGRFHDIVRHVNDFRDRGADLMPMAGFATTKTIAELLADPAALLTPQHWIAPLTADADEVLDELREAARDIDDARAAIADAPPAGRIDIREAASPTGTLKITDLEAAEVLELLRPGRVIDKRDFVADGVPVLTPSALRRNDPSLRYDRFVDPAVAAGRPRTEPGDIAFVSVAKEPYAVVLEEGGAVIGQGIEVVRLRTDWLDRDIVAALLGSPMVTRAVASVMGGMQRVRLRDLTLPALDDHSTRVMRDELARLRALREHAATIQAEADHITALLIEAAVNGDEIREEDHS